MLSEKDKKAIQSIQTSDVSLEVSERLAREPIKKPADPSAEDFKDEEIEEEKRFQEFQFTGRKGIILDATGKGTWRIVNREGDVHVAFGNDIPPTVDFEFAVPVEYDLTYRNRSNTGKEPKPIFLKAVNIREAEGEDIDVLAGRSFKTLLKFAEDQPVLVRLSHEEFCASVYKALAKSPEDFEDSRPEKLLNAYLDITGLFFLGYDQMSEKLLFQDSNDA